MARRKFLIKELAINYQIKEKEVRLLDNEGAQLGIMSSKEANDIADEQNLDLVLISPAAKPPVCKLMDYGKYRYDAMKREKENRKNQKVVELKEIRLSATIDQGDLNTKANSARKFLQNGDKVKVSIRMKGRQNLHPEIAVSIINKFYELLTDVAQIEKNPMTEGRNIFMTLNPITKK